MEIKKFEGSSMREAVKLVRQEFGHDAVIMKTAEKPHKSGGRYFEITAARAGGSVASNQQNPEHLNELIEVSRALARIESKLDHNSMSTISKEQILGLDGRLTDLKQLMISFLADREDSPFKSDQKDIANLLHYLHLMDLDTSLISKLGAYLSNLPEPSDTKDDPDDYYKAYAMRWLLKRIQVSSMINPAEEDMPVHLYVGTSGSGKSSLVIKTANYMRKIIKVNPRIISIDNGRIASSEVLRIHCKLLDVEFQNVESPEKLVGVLTSASKASPILIDTSSINPRIDDPIRSLKELKSNVPRLQTILTLNLAEKSSHLDNIVKHFTTLGIDAVSFTRLDMCWSYGDVINISNRWGVPLLSFGTGSNAPDGIEKATRERVLERIFGINN